MRQLLLRCTGFALLSLLTACSAARPPVPIGEIPKPRPVTASEEDYGHQILTGLSQQYHVDYNDPRLERVTKVVERLTHAAGADQLPWHVYLFRAPEVKNAAATRGNHVFIWSGMLDVVHNDDELATILAHELAHVLAGHTDPDPNEELKKMLVSVGAIAAGVAVSATTSRIGFNLGDLASSATEQIGNGFLVNPYSKDKESEADQIGLFLMADAGFDPQRALEFWGRVQGNPDFSGGPAFFSTHPSAADRISKLNSILPLAMTRYQSGGQRAQLPSSPGIPSARGSGNSSYGARPDNSGIDYSKYGVSPSTPPPPRDIAPPPPARDPLPRDNGPRSGDSFDWGNPSQAAQGDPSQRGDPSLRSDPSLRDRQTPAPRFHPMQRYRVKTRVAVVYQEPTRSSRPVGEFRFDARVDAVNDRGRWVEVDYPDHGYIYRDDLVKVDR